MKKPTAALILIFYIFFQGLSGLVGGAALKYDPTGSSISIEQSWIQGTLFGNYLIPGIILFLVLGIIPLLVFYGLLKNKNWGWLGSVFIGSVLIFWIIIEILVIGYKDEPPLQLLYGLLGVAILIVCFIPKVKHFYNQ